jgi:hypothetical protein
MAGEESVSVYDVGVAVHLIDKLSLDIDDSEFLDLAPDPEKGKPVDLVGLTANTPPPSPDNGPSPAAPEDEYVRGLVDDLVSYLNGETDLTDEQLEELSSTAAEACRAKDVVLGDVVQFVPDVRGSDANHETQSDIHESSVKPECVSPYKIRHSARLAIGPTEIMTGILAKSLKDEDFQNFLDDIDEQLRKNFWGTYVEIEIGITCMQYIQMASWFYSRAGWHVDYVLAAGKTQVLVFSDPRANGTNIT